jgi:hypothetical protein
LLILFYRGNFFIQIYLSRVFNKKGNTMNKMLFMLPCIMASFFVCSMEQQPHNIKLSPRKSSGTPLQSVTKGRRLTDSDSPSVDSPLKREDSPVYSRVRSQSRESDRFVKDENIKSRVLQRTSSADKK